MVKNNFGKPVVIDEREALIGIGEEVGGGDVFGLGYNFAEFEVAAEVLSKRGGRMENF